MLALAVVALLSASASPAVGECTDDDFDGVYLEEGCGPVRDCNDSSATTYPGAVERCDGYDNDCDALIDDSDSCDGTCDLPGAIGWHPRLTPNPADSDRPRLAWSGSEFGLVWRDGRNLSVADLYFTRVSPDGQELMPDRFVTSSDHYGSFVSDIAWTGSAYGVVWHDYALSDVYFARLDATGARLGDDERVTAAPGFQTAAAIAWTGKEFGVAWIDDRAGYRQVYFGRLTPTGERIGGDVLVSGGPFHHDDVDIAWSGSDHELEGGFGIVWSDTRSGGWQIYYARVSPTGAIRNPDVRITDEPGFKWAPKVVSTGWGFALAWEDHREGDDGRVFLTALFRTGIPLFFPKEITTPAAVAIAPDLAWTGQEYGVTWTDFRSGIGATMFARATADGDRLGPERLVMADAPYIADPRIVWTGERYGVASYGGPGGEIFFSAVGCACVDQDGDGFTQCGECDDARGGTHPGALEVCNGIDDDCDGLIDQDVYGVDNDADGLRNVCDNCPLHANPRQSDSDQDGEGDLCDVDDGLIYVRWGDERYLEWQGETGPAAWNVYEGSLAVLRSIGAYTQAPGSNALAQRHCGVTSLWIDDSDPMPPGSVKLVLVTGVTDGVEGSLGARSNGTARTNASPCP